MTFTRYLQGLLLTIFALGPVCAGAFMLRRRLLPRWDGAPARVAEIVIGLALVIGVAEVLGTFGLFRMVPVAAGLAVAGVTAWFVGRDRPVRNRTVVHEPPAGARLVAPQLGRGANVIALAATAVVVGEWFTRTSAALRRGMFSYDTLWYHLPAAARFVQDGSITGLHYFEAQPGTVFQPFNSGILHALGMLLFGNDLLSPLLNLGFLALALVAAWCVGRPFGVAPITLTGAAAVLGAPEIVVSQPGGGYPDIAGAALLLAAVAVLVNADRTQRPPHLAALGVAALATGLALGTKATLIAPVAVLSVGMVVLAPRGERVRRGSLWLALVALGGGFWYVRNLVAVGNPLPLLDLEVGPLSLPSPPIRSRQTTLTEYLFDREAWNEHLLPGIDVFFGPVWWALLALVAAGLGLTLVTGRSRVQRLAALAGIAAFVAFMLGPQVLDYAAGDLLFFVSNLRYVFPGIVLGIVLLPIVPLLAGRPAAWLMVLFALVLAFTQLDGRIWPTEPRPLGRVDGVDSLVGLGVGAVVLAIGGAVLARRRQPSRWHPRAPAVAVAVAGVTAVAGGFGLQQWYLDGRYTDTEPRHGIVEWAQDEHDERIAIVGEILQYQYYGRDLSNHVQYVGDRGVHGAFAPIGHCPQWRRALNAGRYSYVIIAPERYPINVGAAPETAWTETDPAATLVMNDSDTSLFRLDGRLDPAGCDDGT